MKTQKSKKEVFLSIEQFDKNLEDCLTIIAEPTKRNKYYVCQDISSKKSIVHVYII